MYKVLNYVKENFWNILSAFLASIFFVFVVFPFLVNLKFIKSTINSTSITFYIGISSFCWWFLISLWKRVQKFLEKYKNNLFKLEKIPFVYYDSIFMFVFFSFVIIIIWRHEFILNNSSEFELFLLVNSILFFIWFLSALFYQKKPMQLNVPKISANIPLVDEPIESPEQDLLGREKFIKDLYKEIKSLPFDHSFVFGLYGSWGEGKTSILNLLKRKLVGDENLLVLDFNPWYFKDEESILRGFYNQLENIINEKYVLPDLTMAIKKYLQYISFGTNAGINFNLSNADESVEEIKHRIEFYLSSFKIKILILIDDLDRLQREEILLIFKLIKINADLKNTIFVLSFDRGVIQKYLGSDLNSDREFLDKIVQNPINIPAISREDISAFLFSNIDTLLKESIGLSAEKIVNFKEEFESTYRTHITKLFRTFRQVKRYLNGLYSTLPAIKTEVNINDFFILEIICIFYPKLYDDIWRYPWFYIPLEWKISTIYLSPFSPFRDENEKFSKIKEHIENVITSVVDNNEEEGNTLKELLKKIFPIEAGKALGRTIYAPPAEELRVEKRITHPESFIKYFSRKVPKGELPDEFIETTLEIWNTSKELEREEIITRKLFEIQEKEYLLEFLEKLLLFTDKINKELAIYMIKAIYKNVDKFSKERTEDSWNPEYDKALALLLWLINDKIDKEKIQSMLEDIINLTPSIDFAVRVVFFCKKERDGPFYNIYESINFEKLQDKTSKRLKKYFIDENRDIFSELPDERGWAFVLYQWATNWMTFTGKNKEIVNNYVFSLIKDDAKKFVKFLRNLKTSEALSTTLNFDFDKFDKVYDLSKTKNLAEKFKDSSSLSEEDKDLIKKFLELYKTHLSPH